MTSRAERLAGLLSYVEQLEKLRRSAAFSVPDEYFCAYRSEIDGLPGLSFDQPHGGDDVWLSMPRLGEIPPPDPSAALQPWIAFADSADEEPRLRSEILRKAGEEETRLTLASFPGVSKLFSNYLSNQWTPWAQGERPRRRAIGLYNRLFDLHRRIAADGVDAPLELVWGMGVATWKPPGGRGVVKFPLITQSCELSLDETTLELLIRPREVAPVLELDAYVELESSGLASLEATWLEHLKSSEQRPSPFFASSTAPVLKAAISYLDPAGRFDDSVGSAPIPEPAELLLITDSWVLFARRRPERALVEDVRRLKRRLTNDPPAPEALGRLVEGGNVPTPSRVPLRGAFHPGGDSGVPELHFPLPYNDEQQAVAELLEAGDAVVVEAAPGTGAAQTAANLVCRCLARGQRVLVASPIDATLERVQRRIPAELRPLTVAILAEERRGMRQLAHTISSISERLKAIDAAKLEQEVAAHEARASELHASITGLDDKLRGFAARQLTGVSVDGLEMPPAELARLITSEAAEHGWLTDPLDPVTQAAPRVTADDIAALRAARIALGADLVYLGCRLPQPDTLPDEAALLTLHQDLVRARRLEAQVAAGKLLPLLDGTPATLERAAKLRELLRREQSLRAEIAKDPYRWGSRLRTRFEAREDSVARDLIIAARSVAVEELARRARSTQAVEIPPDVELSSELADAVTRRAEGKFGLFSLGKKETRASLDAITVAGDKPASAEQWQRVAAELEHRVKARKLLANWNAMMGGCRLEPVKESGARGFAELAARADFVLRVHELVTRVEVSLRTSVASVFSAAAVRAMPEYEDASHRLMAESLANHLDREQLAGASGRLRDVLRVLEGCSGPVVDSMWAFLTGAIGKDDSAEAVSALGASWRGMIAELRRAAELEPLLTGVERVAATVESSGAPGWAKRLRTVPATAATDPQTPTSWREAWRWRVAVMSLGALEGHETFRQLLLRRRTLEGELVKASRSLTTDRAWLGVHRQSPERIRQALREYTHSLRALGAGEGARVVRNRQISDAALTRARGAVPCWLLPLWRIPEVTPGEISSFHLVVILEASRVDVTALGTLLRGRKLVVIGDRQQLAPPAIAVSERRLRDLGGRFLKDQPHAEALAGGRSLLDLAHNAFGGAVVTLTEQFGSPPAIAAFSNREFYGSRLAPLRLPKTSQRLNPPLIDAHIEGARRAHGRNLAEALAVVEEIEAVLADESLAGRSIGAVTLLGEEQAERIERLLRQRISLRSIVDRKIIVGTPPAFQGRERDLMLVSLGLAPSDRGGVASEAPPAWFNIAASRAVSRLTLFRSVGDSELPPDSLAARLVRYLREPLAGEVLDARIGRDRCDTDLERDLFDALTERGFRVRPKVAVGPLSIDLVVDGADDRRVAVECDGDRADGIEHWARGFARQQTLERVGWTYWRCFASNFVLRREHVLNDLLGVLDQQGIEALGPAPEPEVAATVSRILQASPAALADPGPARGSGVPARPRNRRRPRTPR